MLKKIVFVLTFCLTMISGNLDLSIGREVAK